MSPEQEKIKAAVEELFTFPRQLLGSGYDNALIFLDHLIKLELLEFPTGTRFGTWTVPPEWVIREGWVKYNGEKIIDYERDPLSVVVYSQPVEYCSMDRDELVKHLHYSDERPEATPYIFKFYDRDWGFSVPKALLKKKVESLCENGLCVPELKDFDASVGKIQIEGVDYSPKWEDMLPQGMYEVKIDAEDRPGIMKVGVHTIPGASKREILIFAHLDHPHQANDNLSGVACLLDLANRLKCEHTVKLIFCPETIGSIAYAHTQDISQVDFVIAVDICGNDNTLLLQKSFDPQHRLNRVAHCAMQIMGKPYRKGMFRNVIGSDETVFNDPAIGIPGVMLSRYPYPEYHTSEDTPEKLVYEKIWETSDYIQKMIEIWEKDYVPLRNFQGPLMRSRYGLQSPSPQLNLNFDYLFYSMDGKRSLAELCADFELNFESIYQALTKIEDDGQLRRARTRQGRVKKTAEEKSA